MSFTLPTCTCSSHESFGLTLHCPKDDGSGKHAMECGAFVHACRACSPTMFQKCLMCGTT